MIILKNIEQIAEKYNCLVRDGATGLEDVSAFVETSLDLPKIKEYAAGLDSLDNKKNIIEDMRCMYQIDAWETYGKDAVAVMNEGFSGEYDENPTMKEYKAKGYKLVDANMFGEGTDTFEILTFVKMS